MKSIVLSDITTSAAAKIKKGTLDHLQDSYTEMMIYLANAMGGQNLDPTLTTPYVVTGCVNSGSGSSYVYNQGLILYNNELYFVPSASFTLSGSQTVVATITTSYISGAEYDPVTFTDGSTHNIHRNKTIVLSNAASGSGTFDFLTSAVYVSPEKEQTYSGTVATNWATTCKYIKNRDGLVKLSGTISTTGGVPTVGTTVITLPVGYRPRAAMKFPGLKLKGATLDGCTITISTGGAVQIAEIVTTFGTSDIIYLDHISFYTPLVY